MLSTVLHHQYSDQVLIAIHLINAPETEPKPKPATLQDQPWYFPTCDRSTAVALLEAAGFVEGMYLVRNSSTYADFM